jgi:CheY-like chemotaxis protein
MLAENRYRPIEAATVEAAIAVCEGHAGTIDALLTDVIMPQMSGRELAVRLQNDYGIDRVLYISGYDDEVTAQHGILDDDLHFLQKPFLESDLLRALRVILDAGPRRERESFTA